MSRLRDQVGPILAALVVVAVAVSVVVLLQNANDRGVDALTTAKLQQVQTTADSFNARVTSQLSSSAALSTRPWQLTVRSTTDQQTLNSFNLDPTAQSGYYLVDATGRITAGILLRPGRLGSRVPDWNSVMARLAQQTATVLPVNTTGATTDLPNYAYVLAIKSGSAVRGALVAEQALTPTSSFEQEISQLAERGSSTATWSFIDDNGRIVASTVATDPGKPIRDTRYVVTHSGVSHLGGDIVVTADIPSIGWRVVFRESESQFTGGLSGPLQTTGLIVVLLLLVVGLLLVAFLVRRLQVAREQQRRLRELTRSQAEFISVVSHELRTPVAGILGFLQTTVDHWESLSDADRLSTVRRAATNARRLQAMTRDVLDTESLESGRFGYAFHRIDLLAELRTAVESSNDADPAHPARLGAVDEVAGVLVNADADRMQQVLANLLENARRNSPAGELVSVEAALEGDLVRVSVVDHGAGIDPEHVERIFDKFVRGDNNAVTGTGLGLYIARSIVQAHGGRIWCESDPGRRTAFVFELPVAATADRPVPAGV